MYSHPSFIKYILEVFFHLPAVGDNSLEKYLSSTSVKQWPHDSYFPAKAEYEH